MRGPAAKVHAGECDVTHFKPMIYGIRRGGGGAKSIPGLVYETHTPLDAILDRMLILLLLIFRIPPGFLSAGLA